MIGYHSVSVIADAYLKGIGGFDAELALEAMVDSATRDHFGLDAYRRDGFIGADEEGESVSKTLEYAYDDCVHRAHGRGPGPRRGRRASSPGAARPGATSFDPETRLLPPAPQRPVAGALRPAPGGLPLHRGQRLAVPLRRAAPRAAAHRSARRRRGLRWPRSTRCSPTDSATTGRDQADITGRMGQYAHGNEPSHHVAWLYHFAGRPRPQRRARARRSSTTFYTDGARRPDRQRGLRPDVQLVRAGRLRALRRGADVAAVAGHPAAASSA